MALILIAVALIILWVVLLCKIFYSSSTKAAFFSEGEAVRKRNILLVVAHPDDETIFFSPTILYLTSQGNNVHILCMSTGNADGKGDTRKEELYLACASLQVGPEQVMILDHPDLQDGFNHSWSQSLLAEIVKKEIANRAIDLLITFDCYGVSGHQNHRDVSVSMLRKYSGPVDIWWSLLSTICYPRQQMCSLINGNPRKSFFAMAQHQSQWIWFRKMFMSFSSYLCECAKKDRYLSICFQISDKV
ncbi:hypothetical protein MKW98_031856 [Papaver atlanticum]|uniref:N-acetylglucosaminylphosphatidylinositol deacetylase n=1 Tax=Papaver atlanticum TaxID=357466 RepID=A0AAD4SDR2_9MAGN|nr:hypothetical protein MKW98_031856 [Papaver atlanticum]